MRKLLSALIVALALMGLLGVAPSTRAGGGTYAREAQVARIDTDQARRVTPPKPRQHIKTTTGTQQSGPHAIYHTARYQDTGAKGSCVWYAMQMRPDLYLSGAGAAANLAQVARSRGYHVGNLPAVGALVVIQRGVDFAYWPSAQWANSVYGHVAYVLAVYPDGSYLMASMASPAPFVVTDWRGRPGNGISFIYG